MKLARRHRGRSTPSAVAPSAAAQAGRGRTSPGVAPPPPSAPIAKGQLWAALALILAGTVALYLSALHTQFFADDFLFLDQVRDRSLLETLSRPDPLSNFFRPVSRQLYFWLVAGLTNESPVAFHVGNLVTLLVAIALLFVLTRRLAGDRAAAVAAGLVSVHYAADVPVRWACGSQELLAIAFALATILLHVSGRRVWAAVAMLLAALSKEVILLTPAIAVLADRAPGEPWPRAARRAWPLAAAVVAWGLIWLSMPHRHVAQGTEVEFDLITSPLAALVHLVQVIPGIEWLPGRGGPPKALPPILTLAAALGALAIAWRVRRARGERANAGRPPDPRHAVMVGVVWTLLATLPVAAVAILWSAYYYLFAVFGAALAAGALLARAPAWLAGVTIALIAWGSANARTLEDFGIGRDPWTPTSHINAHYIDRSNRITDNYLGSLRRAHPVFVPGSTLFFTGLQGNVAFQRGDGPLLRWAYRDSSLRSYYVNMFSRQTARTGPVLFFVASGDTLKQLEPGPDLFHRVAFGMIVSDQPKGARDALQVAAERLPNDPRTPYWQAWVSLALGDTAAARQFLARAVAVTGPGAATSPRVPAPPSGPERDAAYAQFNAGDTLGAVVRLRRVVREHPFDAAPHALLADLLLVRDRREPESNIEAYAARVLAPGDPYAWRRWAMVQLDRERHLESLMSFQKYFKLGGQAAAADAEAHHWAESIRERIPKGAVDPEDMPQ